jgi:hypothetical protein
MNCVDIQHSFETLSGYLTEWTNLSNTCIQEKQSHILIFKLVSDHLLVFVDASHSHQVCYDVLLLDIAFDLCQLSLHLFFIARDNADIETLGSQFMTNVKTVAIRATSNDSPRFLILRAIPRVQVELSPTKMPPEEAYCSEHEP